MKTGRVTVVRRTGVVVSTLLLAVACGSEPSLAPAGSVSPAPVPSTGANGAASIGGGALGQIVWTTDGSEIRFASGVAEPQTVALPAELVASAPFAVAGTRDRHVLLAQSDPKGGVLVFASDGIDWTSTRLTPEWPSGYFSALPQPSVSFAVAPPGVVALVATVPMSTAVAFSNMFVSIDGGRTFRTISFPEHHVLNMPWDSVTLLSQERIVVTGGPASTFAFVSGDGGASWDELTVVDLPKGHTTYAIGAPLWRADESIFPVYSDNSNDELVVTFTVVRSDDVLAPSAALGELDLHIPYTAGQLAMATTADSVWVMGPDGPGGRSLYRAETAGRQAWQSVPVKNAASAISGLHVWDDDLHADTVGVDTDCSNGKTECTTTFVHRASDDGGSTWFDSF